MANTIEFAPPSATNSKEISTWAPRGGSRYKDLILKPEQAERCLRFKEGINSIRILPEIKGSAHPWIMRIHALEFEGGKFAHPKSLKAKTRSVFDIAYEWALENCPSALFSKTNEKGVRLLTDPYYVFWAIVEENGNPVARIFLKSGYDGSRGAFQGLGYRIWKLAQETDGKGKLILDPRDVKTGVMLEVEKQQPKGARFPTYSLRLGKQPAPIEDLIARMAPEEIAAICPLENVIRELSEDEQWACLEKVMAPETVAIIRKNAR